MNDLTKYNNDEFNLIIKDIIENETVQQMKNFRQHYDTSCYEHCMNVAYYGFLICKKLNLDYIAIAKSSMLHDLFLYDWRKKQPDKKNFHGFRHPRIALNNAKNLFDLSNKEQDIILKHMWPITIIFPKYPESYIITLVDKFCAIQESCKHYQEIKIYKKMYKYAYLLLNIILFSTIL